jgi:hypothetical protein
MVGPHIAILFLVVRILLRFDRQFYWIGWTAMELLARFTLPIGRGLP